MKEFRKNIVLLPAEYNGVNNQKGILSLEYENNNLDCVLKCFNIKNTSEEFLVGIVVNDQIFKTKVLASKLSNLTYRVNAKVKPYDKISCLILNTRTSDYDILLWGSTETSKDYQNATVYKLENNLVEEGYLKNANYEFSKIDKQSVNNNSYQPQESNDVNKNEQQISQYDIEQQELEKYIDKVYNLTNNAEQIAKDIDEKFEEKENEEDGFQSKVFFDRVEKQINNLLSTNEPDEVLQDIIPGGRFCKVNMEDGYYVFGVVYDDSEPRYICYGIPCQSKGLPPKELEGFCQWLPLDVADQMGKGYWISYQDANSGENIKVEVIS